MSAVRILDIEKLTTKFGDDLSMSCSDWNEAAENYFVFQQSRDIEGPNGRYSTWLRKHSEFFSQARFSALPCLPLQLNQCGTDSQTLLGTTVARQPAHSPRLQLVLVLGT